MSTTDRSDAGPQTRRRTPEALEALEQQHRYEEEQDGQDHTGVHDRAVGAVLRRRSTAEVIRTLRTSNRTVGCVCVG